MKLHEFALVSGAGEETLRAQLAAFNATAAPYAREATVAAVFAAQAQATPEAVAAIAGETELTYEALDRTATQLARVLLAHAVTPETVVAVLLDDAVALSTALVGILRAGATYCPLDADLPYDRLRYLLADTGARVLIAGRRDTRLGNRLQWDCPALDTLLLLDAADAHAEPEAVGEKMKPAVWDYVGQTMVDDISGGGWQSSFTGAWLSREVMDDYGDNIRQKLAPYLTPASRVLEIGCASGISLVRLAPLVGDYIGTDLSAAILRWTAREVARRGLTNVRLHALPADAIDTLATGPVDVVVINSVVQCFSGPNYLRQVLRQALARLAPQGLIFLGNVFDQDLKDAFVAELRAFQRVHGTTYRTKTDYSEELFLNRAFLADLRHDLPAIAEVTCSPLLGTHESELSRFSFDALLRIDQTGATAAPLAPRHKRQLDRRTLAGASAAPLPERAQPETAAYVMYTSGTSGRPKGVVVPHRAILRLVQQRTFVTLDASTRILMTGALAFDASTFEIWGALLHGGTLVRAPKLTLLDSAAVRHLIRTHGITTLWLTASLFNQFVDHDLTLFAGLRELLVGGERLSPPHVAAVQRAYPALTLINGYGPTENTTFTTCHRIGPVDGHDIPIGRPLANTEVQILDPAARPVPIGLPGEICAAGDGLARGYLGDPALTADRFRPHPSRPGARLYWTGDRGRWTADGVVEFLGRIDDQIKIRGHRIEPAEIECWIRRSAGVRDAIVTVRESGGSGHVLVAYVTGEASLDMVREDLRRELPEAFVPTVWIPLDVLPLTTSGKIDRRSLPSPDDVTARQGTSLSFPTTEQERVLKSAWETVLGRRGLSVDDDFFHVGGDSLRAIQVMGRLRKTGWDVAIRDLFRYSTIAALAPHLHRVLEGGDAEPVIGPIPLTPIQRWFFATHRGPIGWFNQTICLQPKERIDEEPLRRALQAVVDRHDMLRAVFDGASEATTAAIQQRVLPPAPFRGFSVHDLRAGKDVTQTWAQIADSAQSSFDLSTGPLFRAVLGRLDDGDRLLLTAHHLVIDAASWPILVEDLEEAYETSRAGRPLTPAARQASFRDRAVEWQQLADAGLPEPETAYWRALEQSARSLVREDDLTSSTYGDVDSVECCLTPAETSAVIHGASADDRTEILDLLLTALARALKRWTNSERWVVLLESHGRDPMSRELPLEREVGWFTTLYPLALDASGDDIAEQLLRVKLTRRSVPRRGAGYLVWNPSGPSTAALTFNYFGALSVSNGDRLFSDMSGWTGSPIAADLTRPCDIDLSGIVRDGQLQWTVYFHRRRMARSSMDRFLTFYKEELLAIGEHRHSVIKQQTTAGTAEGAAETARELHAMLDRVRDSGSPRQRLVEEARQAWAIPADERDWEKEPAITDMSVKLTDAARFGNPLGDDTWVALNRTDAPDVFAFPPATGDLLGYLPLAQLLPQYRWSAFNYVASADRYRVYADCVEREARQPAVFIGHSGGGHLAYLTAVELERRGVPLRALVMIDAGRLIAPLRFDEEESEIVAMAFLRDPNIARHANTPPLRDKVRRRIRAYYQRLATETHDHVIDTSIHALVAENAPASHRSDATGVVAESVQAWRDVTRGVFRVWQGGGDHARMLLAPHLEANVQVLASILAEVSRPSGVAS